MKLMEWLTALGWLGLGCVVAINAFLVGILVGIVVGYSSWIRDEKEEHRDVR